MGRRTTIHDIAAAAGVSVATVSKAINGRYGVARETAARVHQAVDELGYESNLFASRLRGLRTGVIGVLVPEFEPFSSEILKGVGAAAQQLEYDVLAYSGAYGPDRSGWELRSLRRLSGNLIDGAIVVTPSTVLVDADVPLVAVDPHMGPGDTPTVESDSFGGAVTAVRYLVELGHTRIAFVAGRTDLRSSRARDAGYKRALSDAGIIFDPHLVRSGQYDATATRSSVRDLLGSPARPTAVFASNDSSALAVMQVATELGLDVPRDVSVVGFDDVLEASRMTPPLTTVRQPMRRLGQTATEMLVAQLRGRPLQERHIRLSTILVPRGTTAPPAPGTGH